MTVVWSHASGSALADCVALAHDSQGSRVFALARGAPLSITVCLDVPAGLAGAWRADDGGVAVVSGAGSVWRTDAGGLAAGRWSVQDLGLRLRGVHGAGRRLVVWGARPTDGVEVLATADGEAWSPVPGPGFRVAEARVAADGVWAAGDGGLARWDGEGWSILEGPALTAVAPGADGVVVAAGDGTVSVVDASSGRSTALGRVPGPAAALAAWRGGVWVGGAFGLWRLGAGAVRPDRAVTALDGRGDLLVTAGALVFASADGDRFAGALRDTPGR